MRRFDSIEEQVLDGIGNQMSALIKK